MRYLAEMRAWVLSEIGDIGSYELREVPDLQPGPGEIRVALRASALNHMDLWVARGKPAPALPHVPGADGAGVVDAVGQGVSMFAKGDEVVVNAAIGCGSCAVCVLGEQPLCADLRIVGEHLWGTHADAVVIPAGNAVRRPASLGWSEAASFGMATGNALRLLRRARLAEGDTVLVVGFGGGVSAAGLSVGLALGARVWVTTRHRAKGERAVVLGAGGWFDSNGPFDEQIRAATDGRGVDVVFDNVGPATWDRSIRALAHGGRLATCGGTSGQQVALDLPLLFWRHLEIIGASVQSHSDFADAADLVASGLVPVQVDSVHPFDDYPVALQRLAGGGQLGKVVLDR